MLRKRKQMQKNKKCKLPSVSANLVMEMALLEFLRSDTKRFIMCLDKEKKKVNEDSLTAYYHGMITLLIYAGYDKDMVFRCLAQVLEQFTKILNSKKR